MGKETIERLKNEYLDVDNALDEELARLEDEIETTKRKMEINKAKLQVLEDLEAILDAEQTPKYVSTNPLF